MATLAGRTDVMKILLNRGASTKLRDKAQGYTALLVAIAVDNAEAISLLTSEGCDIFTTSKNKDSPLHKAASNCSEATVQLLLDLGADVRGLSGKGSTALPFAAAEGKSESVRTLIYEGADVNAAEAQQGWHTPLHIAALNDCNVSMAILLVHGARINARNRFGCTALHFASHKGNKKGVQLLVDSGSDVNTVEGDGRTAVHDAIWMEVAGDVRVIEDLLDAGSDLEARNEKRYTPLHLAAHFGNRAAIPILYNEGGNPLALTQEGCTPLHEAAFNGHVECAEELASKRGIQKNTTNKIGQTPMALFDFERGPHPWYRLRPSRLRHLSDSEVDRIHQALQSDDDTTQQTHDSPSWHVQALTTAVVAGLGILGSGILIQL
eukprot:GILJ01023782.1.p1 GENE.GILJ01023782.1~~GILJ01023782.1.p1  ORF type:complete len:390 (+),score=55.13 GILJ01023782.1:35-1171(+)